MVVDVDEGIPQKEIRDWFRVWLDDNGDDQIKIRKRVVRSRKYRTPAEEYGENVGRY